MIPHSRPTLDQAESEALLTVLSSGQLAQGPQVEAFERAMASYVGVRGGVAVSSGTAALELALRALRIGAGDEVVLPSYVCLAPWLAVERVGAVPRLVDIEPTTYNIDPQETARALSRRTRAIIVPHLFGLPADLTALECLGVPLIEDCAQTLGACERGRPVGGVGRLAVCSFYATKLLCAGEGGMVLSNDEALLEAVRELRAYDERPQLRPGAFNFKLSELHASLGLVQLRRLPERLARRAALAAEYDRALANTPVLRPEVPRGRTHAYYRYVVRLDARRRGAPDLEGVLAGLEGAGVQARRPVYRPIHRYVGTAACPEADAAMGSAVSLPLYPDLADDEASRVVEAVQAVLAG